MCSFADLMALYSGYKMAAAGSSKTSVTLQPAQCSFLYVPAGKLISDSYFSNIFSFFCADMKLQCLH